MCEREDTYMNTLISLAFSSGLARITDVASLPFSYVWYGLVWYGIQYKVKIDSYIII